MRAVGSGHRVAAQAPKAAGKGSWTKEALEAHAAAKADRWRRIKEVVDYAKAHDLKAGKALKNFDSKEYGDIGEDTVRDGIAGRLKHLQGRCDYDVLTDAEEKRLVEWCMASAQNMNAALEQQGEGKKEVSKQVRTLLKARYAARKKDNFRGGIEKLTAAEMRFVTEPDHTVSHVWCQRFLARHPQISVKGEVAKEDVRAKKQNEAAVTHHFYGEAGLEAELLDAGIMDRESKTILDPRRFLWTDETPQFIDNNAVGSKPRAIGITGQRLVRSGNKNREVLSVGMTQSLDGFQHAAQLNIKRENFTVGMMDCFDTPEYAPKFDDSIYTLDKKSTRLVMCKSEGGVQTAETFLEYLEQLNADIDARSAAEVAAGRPPIERPVVLGTDNHTSRYAPEVLEAAGRNEGRLGIRLWAEESQTSHFLQWLDKINKMFHSAYNKAKKEYKAAYKHHFGEEPTIGIVEFLEIFGGCREFGLTGCWFTWCTAQNIVAACRASGFLGNRLAPELIDRTEFIDKVVSTHAPEPPMTLEERLRKARGDLRIGSLAAVTAERDALVVYVKQLEAAPFDPATIPGLLEPKPLNKQKRQRDQSRIDISEGGSFTLRKLKQKSDVKLLAVQAEEQRKEAARQALAEKKAAAQAVADQLVEEFARCEKGCVCHRVPCPMAKMKKCPHCGDIKQRVCQKPECKAKNGPLLLMGPLLLTGPPS